MSRASEYLIEIGAYGSGPETLRVASCPGGYVTSPTDIPANTIYEHRVVDPGYFDRAMFDPGKTRGNADVAAGDIIVSNVDGECDTWLDKGFSGWPLVVRRLDGPTDAYDSSEVFFRGTIEGLHSAQAMTSLTLRLRDRRMELRKPLQTNRYTGTTTSGGLAGNLVNGTADMKDQPKPQSYGKVFSVPAVVVNPFDLIYQVHDGAVESIALFDGGIPLVNAGNSSTAADLQSAAILPGQYRTCHALGIFRLGGSPARNITANVVEGATGQRNAGAVVSRMLAKMGLSGDANVSSSSVAAFSAAAPQEVGIWVGDDQTGLEAISAILDSVGGFIVPDTLGVFELGQFTAPGGAAAWAITYSMISGEEVLLTSNADTDGVPAYRLILRYQRVYLVETQTDLHTCVSAADTAFRGTEWREVKADTAGVQTKHPLSPEMTVETLLVSAADAATEAARLAALYSVRRDALTLHVRRDDAAAMVLGSSGTLTYPRHGYAGGKAMRVIGRRDMPANELVQLTLWG